MLCAPDVLISSSVITVVEPPNFFVSIVVSPILFGSFSVISSAILELIEIIIKKKILIK